MEDNYSLLKPDQFGGKRPRKINNLYVWVVLGAVAASLLVGIYLRSRPGREAPREKGELQKEVRQIPEKEVGRAPLAPAPENNLHRIAIIIDDVGYSLEVARRFIDMEEPLSFAILPYAPYSKQIAALAKERGKEVLLHVPMEPEDYPETHPGPGALLVDMTQREIISTLDKDLALIPQAVGVNNHMGSRFTADRRAMETVVKRLKERGLFYVDSFTAPDTVAYRVAKEAGLKTARRTVFLDNVKEAQAIVGNVTLLAEKAKGADGLVAIGHAHPATYEALQQTLSRLQQDGVRIVPVSELVK